jgi:hypothetical protein
MSRKASSLLLVDSIDRYIKVSADAPSNFQDIYLETKFKDGRNPNNPVNFNNTQNTFPGNRFQLFANQPFIYGNIKTIAIAQLQMYYAVPTITPNNNKFYIINQSAYSAGQPWLATITIPVGFYTEVELCSMIQFLVEQSAIFPHGWTCQINNEFASGTNITRQDIIWEAADDPDGDNVFWCFYNPFDDDPDPLLTLTDAQKAALLRTYDTLSIGRGECGFPGIIDPEFSSNDPIKYTSPMKLLYTAYVDILSNLLTKYQDVKDSDTKPLKQSNFIARVYLNSQGSPQTVGSVAAAPGSRPFYVVATLSNTKVIQWSEDEAVYNMDFELRDQYGNLLYWDSDLAPTEFQLTLLCSE